jgi:hypothetical protein
MKPIVSATLVAMLVLCTGCASVTQGTTHSLRIETITDKGEQIAGADCSLTNDQGTTVAKSGTSTLVRRSSKDLEVTCAATGQPDAKARLVSRANAGLAGNIILGGAIGAVIDHNTGAAYTYPTWVRMVFGQFSVFDRREEREGVAMNPSGAVPPQGTSERIPVAAALPHSTPVRLSAATPPPPVHGGIAAADTFDYRLTDRQTGYQQTVVLRAERMRAGEVSFNGGSRVETAAGAVKLSSALVGELDSVTPPEGWMPGGRVPTGSWKMHHRSIVPGSTMQYDLTATVDGEQPVTVDGHEWNSVRVSLRGWAENTTGLIPARASYQATAWIAPELGRVVRFEVRSRTTGNSSAAQFSIDEVTELVRVGRD